MVHNKSNQSQPTEPEDSQYKGGTKHMNKQRFANAMLTDNETAESTNISWTNNNSWTRSAKFNAPG